MILQEDLKRIINLQQEFVKEWDKNPVLNIESRLYDVPLIMFDTCINSVLTETGADLLFWWLYENVDKIIYLKDGSEIDLTNLDDLLDYLYKESYVKS